MSPFIQLQDQYTKLTIAPELGGAITRWQRVEDGFDLLRPLTLEHLIQSTVTARQSAAFALIPWSNRIAQGGTNTPNGWFELPANTIDSAFAMHGSTWQQAWQVLEQDQHHLRLVCESKSPVHLRVEQQIQLHDGCLTLNFHLTHLDERPFLHGYGWHPFFYRNEYTQLQSQVGQMWHRDEQGLSTHEADLPCDLDFNTIHTLPERLVDHAFSGWQGRCRIQQPDLGYELELTSQDAAYLIMYLPLKQPFFCLEPVSHPINAHHLPNQPGLKYLKQNDELTWQVKLQYKIISAS
ncbi:aldose 1-epimerase [Acinetobacter sp. MD2(2019)]|uniref:aldose 1-epimerase n=1 Tax=Acinetobacter sp. MD2(2019) TaxID=2605273 RepID=UPI002D1E522B|nr:aldose 1-epimerase [Acinetobacter sp. MD2(2019)]MEB3754154.1 aldose 1-epimerase [Acinetobacter sp. MD2(2019)]